MKCTYRINLNHEKSIKIIKEFQKQEKQNIISNFKIHDETIHLKMKGLKFNYCGTKFMGHENVESENDYTIITFDNKPKQNPLSLF